MDHKSIDLVRLVLAGSLLVLLGVIGAADVFLAYRYGPDHTVSAVIQGWSTDWPILPMMIGLLLGHLLWPLRIPGPHIQIKG